MKLLHFVMEDKKEWWTSLGQWLQATLSSSSLLYLVVRHLLCLSVWLILCFSALAPKKCQSRSCQSQRMTSQAPAWEGIGSLPEIHIVQRPLQVSLKRSVAFSRAEDRVMAQLGKGFIARQWGFFMVWHFIARWCVVMSPVSHHKGWSPASQFSAPLLSSGFASTRDLALIKLRSSVSERIMALLHARAWALQEIGATEVSDGAVRWIKELEATFFLITGLVVVLLMLDSFRRNWTSSAVYSSGKICAKGYVICKLQYKVHVKPVYFDTVDLRISSSGKPICGWQVTKQLGSLWSQRSKPRV